VQQTQEDDLLVTQGSEVENEKEASNFNHFNEASNVIKSYEKKFSRVESGGRNYNSSSRTEL
jgi:hypothetical protein